MAYNPYSDVKSIYHYKWAWDEANKAGDENKKKDAAAAATQYYQNLRDNGYGNVADELSAKDFTGAKSIHDYYAKVKATKTKPYLYSLGQAYGMSESEVDKLIGWTDTGEISFGGKNIGAPDAVVDGASYWHDTSKLDEAFNDYISRSGTTRSKAETVNQENEKLFSKLYGEYDDLKKTNPFETEEGKSILAKYSLAGLQGRDNEVASGSASNGGNIDSFSAANALRQQASLVNQGQSAVLSAHQQKLDHARNLLSDIGVHIDRVYNQDETTKQNEFDRSETVKNNETARLSEQASVTGYIPEKWSGIQNDPFLKYFVDESGKLKSEHENTDFQYLYNEAKANGDDELANNYAILRGLKIFGNLSEYGKYLGTGNIAYYKPKRTADYDLTKQQIDSGEKISMAGLETEKYTADKNAEAQKQIADTEAEIAKYSTDAATEQTKINAQSSENIANAQLSAQNENVTAQAMREAYLDGQYNTLLGSFAAHETRKRGFIVTYIKPLFDNYKKTGSVPSEETIKTLIMQHTAESNIDVDDAEKICRALGVSEKWISAYEDNPSDAYGGMVLKNK